LLRLNIIEIDNQELKKAYQSGNFPCLPQIIAIFVSGREVFSPPPLFLDSIHV
jgi:hypothetical protein